jgi:hypothetical protein
MNSAMIRKQKREYRKKFLTEVFGWCSIASLTYLIWLGFFFMLSNPLSTLFN